MKFLLLMIAALIISGCQPGQDGQSAKQIFSQTAAKSRPSVIDISTPDKALKSYWQMKDFLRKADSDWRMAQDSEFIKARAEFNSDARKLMTGDVLSDYLEDEIKNWQLKQYDREIVDLKQDTESRATVIAKIRNSTPVPEGAIVTDSDLKKRKEGKKFKYVLEKEADGWRVSQVYEYDEFRIRYEGKDPWKKIFQTEKSQRSINTWVYGLSN